MGYRIFATIVALGLAFGGAACNRDAAESRSTAAAPQGTTAADRSGELQRERDDEIARFEKSYVQGLLSACRGNITKAAEVAQKNRRAFWHLIQKYQIDVKRFKKISSEP